MSTWMVYAAVVTLLLGGAAWVLEQATHNLRFPSRWIWGAALAASWVVPVAALVVRADTPSPMQVQVEPVADGAAPLAIQHTAPDIEPSGRAFVFPRLHLPGTPSLPARLDPLALAGWLLLSLTLLHLLARSLRQLLRARREWPSQRVNGRDVLISEAVGPAVIGVLRTAIVMPRWALVLSAADRELMLRHEEEHRRAGDAPLLMAAVLLSVMLPWNLPLWWQLRRLRLAVEVDCDRRVLRRTKNLRRYASLLVEIGRRRNSPLLSLALAEPASFLERRIRTMTQQPKPRHLRNAGLGIAAALLVIAAIKMDRPAAAAETPSSELLRLNSPSAPVGPSGALEQATDQSAGRSAVSGTVDKADVGAVIRDGQVAVEKAPAGGGVDAIGAAGGPLQPEALVGQIRGLITDATMGAPLSEVQVSVAGTNLVSFSATNGAYVLTGVPAGTHELRVGRIGFASASRVVALTDGAVLTTDFALTPSESRDLVVTGTAGATRRREVGNTIEQINTVDLPDRPTSVAEMLEGRRREIGYAGISGRVTDSATGAPLADVQVYLVGANLGAITRQNGQYVILNVPTGTYTLRAERIGLVSVSREITVEAGSSPAVDFALAASALTLDQIVVTGTAGAARRSTLGRISGRVTEAASGAPLSDVQVYLLDQNLGGISRQTGVFVLLNVPAGTYTLRAERVGLRTESREITVGAGEAIEVNFALSFSPPGEQARSDGASSVAEQIGLLGTENPAPILIIDGVRVPTSGRESPLSRLSPNEVQSVEVIKGEAAERIYGSDARGGVITVVKKK